MKELGLGLFIIGLVSLIIPFLGMRFLLLTWLDQWGTTTSWLIRGGATLVGLLLYLRYRERE